MGGHRVLMIVADQLQLDRRVLHEASSLAHRGWTVRITPAHPGMGSPQSLPSGVIIGPMPAGDPVGVSMRRKGLMGFLRTHVPRAIQEAFYFRLADPARRMVASFVARDMGEWDVLICHDLPLLPAAVALRDMQGSGRIVFDAHELYDEQFDHLVTATARGYWRSIEDRYTGECDGVMTVTPRIAEELQRRHSLAETPTVLLNACPFVDQFDDRTRLHTLYGIPLDRPIVLCQGGLVPGRSLEELTRAWTHLPSPRPALVFLGYGWPDYIRRLQDLVDRLRLQGDVFLGKAVPPDEVLQYTCGASLGLVSNRGDGLNNTDGAPNRLFEYIQARVPVLAYEHNGIRQILDQTGTGWVVRWESPQHLASIIMDKLSEAARLPRGLLDDAARRFCWENEEGRLLALVSRVLGRE